MSTRGIVVMLIGISRWRFWLYLAGPYLIGFAAGANDLIQFQVWQFPVCLAYFGLPANILLYGLNDLYDADTDALNPRKGSVEVRLASSHRRFVVGMVLGATLLGAALAAGQKQVLASASMIAFLVLSVMYSAPPIRFKSRPYLDSASNILYACPLFVGYSQAAGKLPGWEIVVAAFLWTSAMHLFSAIPDIKSDISAGIRTTANSLGFDRSLVLCSVLWMGCCALLWARGVLMPFSLLAAVYPLAPLALLLRERRQVEIVRVYLVYPFINAVAGVTLFFLKGLRLWGV